MDTFQKEKLNYTIKKTKNTKQMMKLLLESAEMDNEEAQMVLGFCYHHGIYFEKNANKSLQQVTSAAMLGSP